ncbi:eukaryotic translation initiation factor 2C, 2 [Borealophlyctis nickersoniae]|nr:eukaryotic translation initiation factor 2C, 2 [Borealophlyctis nickersoniae]
MSTATSATTESEVASSMERLSLQQVQFVPRPPLGKNGRMTRVRANYVEVLTFPKDDVIHYDVAYTPEAPPAFIRKLYKVWEDKYRDSPQVGGAYPVFDGRKNMFAARPLPFGDSFTFEVVEPEGDNEEEIAERQKGRDAAKKAGREVRGPRTYKMRVRKVATIKMDQLREFLAGRQATTPYDAIMCLDIVLRHKPSYQYVTVGRSFYTQAGAQSIGGGAEVWPGYHQSIRPAGTTMKINIDVSATAFYEAGPLVQFVSKVLGLRPDALQRPLPDREVQRLEKTVKGLRVQTSHRGAAGRRIFRIAKLGDTSLRTTFTVEGRTKTIAEYFKEQYGKDLQYPNLPVLVVGDPSKNMFLPMEVCDVVPGQRHTRKLNERQTAEMIRFTCQPPHVRSGKISQALTLFDYQNNEYCKEFKITAADDLFIANARIMPAPQLIFGGGSRPENPRDGTWTLRDKRFFEPAGLGAWAVVCFMQERDCPPNVRDNFVKELCNTCAQLGMNISKRDPPSMYANPAGNVEGALKAAFMQAGNAAGKRPEMLLIVLPNTGVPLYAEIKRVSDTVLGIPTQCVQNRHVSTAKRQYCQNVALKMNVKLGGTNLTLAPNTMPWVASQPTIIIGADVTHPSGAESSRPSVAALVGSMDIRIAKYAASVRVKPAKEIYNEMSLMVIELLKNFYQSTGRKPSRILYYRDGVSEGQFGEVMTAEVNAIRRACHRIEKGYKPAISYLVVQKRHHTRMFPLDKNDADRSGNVMPGAVVESGITHPTEFDYFLMSHPGLQGTSRPCHYNVLFDENNLGSDNAEEVTYKLAYLYARATRAVSVVTPAYYANIVASRARFHAKGEHWSDSESEAGRGEAAYAPVKTELAKLMWYM